MTSYLLTSYSLFTNPDHGVFHDIIAAVEFANVNGIQQYVFQFVQCGHGVVIVFGFQDYNSYLEFCYKMHIQTVDEHKFSCYTRHTVSS